MHEHYEIVAELRNTRWIVAVAPALPPHTADEKRHDERDVHHRCARAARARGVCAESQKPSSRVNKIGGEIEGLPTECVFRESA